MKLPLEYLPDGSTPSAMADVIAETVSDFDNIVQHFNEQLNIFPQEKIHLHTDRDVYISGEKIWFKAYVTDALTHLDPTHSRYVYVELISPVDTLMHSVMVRPTDGMFYGNLPLTEYVPTGNYTLRAYTRYMENLGDDYFFKKNIRIENLMTPVNQQRPTANRGTLKDDYSISFFPEGGNLPEGVVSKVAFKALNINGYPEIVSGVRDCNPATLVKELIQRVIEAEGCQRKEKVEMLALSLAKSAAIRPGKALSIEEMESLTAALFSLNTTNLTPDGKIILSIMTDDELSKRFG
jgi:hypothetical protein